MKRFLLFSLVVSITATCGCASTENTSSAKSASASENVTTSQTEPISAPVDYYSMASAYLAESLKQSVLMTINDNQQAVRRLSFPEKAYTLCGIFPDGQTALMESDRESGGEATAAHYLTMSLADGQIVGNTNEKQWGLARHKILDDNMIGFGSGAVIGGQEATWQPIQLFDAYYKPLDVKLDFDFGNEVARNGERYRENSIVGIGYDPVLRQYAVSYAQDRSLADTEDLAFYKNQLGLAFFDEYGSFIKNIIPESVSSPFSRNILVLTPNDPVVSGEYIIVKAMEQSSDQSEEKFVTLIINMGTSEVKKYPYVGHMVLPTASGDYLFLNEGENAPLLLRLDSSLDEEWTLPQTISYAGFESEFYTTNACLSGPNLYISAELDMKVGDDYIYLTGIFLIQGETPVLLQLLPSQSRFVMVPDASGGITFGVTGIGVQVESGDSWQDRRDMVFRDMKLLEEVINKR